MQCLWNWDFSNDTKHNIFVKFLKPPNREEANRNGCEMERKVKEIQKFSPKHDTKLITFTNDENCFTYKTIPNCFTLYNTRSGKWVPKERHSIVKGALCREWRIWDGSLRSATLEMMMVFCLATKFVCCASGSFSNCIIKSWRWQLSVFSRSSADTRCAQCFLSNWGWKGHNIPIELIDLIDKM